MAFRAEIIPRVAVSGEDLTVAISGAVKWASHIVQVTVNGSDDIDVTCRASVPVSIDLHGNGSGEIRRLTVNRETILDIWQIRSKGCEPDSGTFMPAIMDLPSNIESLADIDIEKQRKELNAKRESRYRKPLGREASGNFPFKVMYLIEGLMITRPMQSRHGTMFPLPSSLYAVDRRMAVETALRLLHWSSTVNVENWNRHLGRNDYCVVEFPKVWAGSEDAAHRLAIIEAIRMVNTSSFMRMGAPRFLMVVIEAQKEDGSTYCRMGSLTRPYHGNLLGGSIAGERQSEFLSIEHVLGENPEKNLYVSLFNEAMTQNDADSRYFKFWGVLEIIAANVVPRNQQVILPDGKLWPDGQTTSNAAPRVYELIRRSGVPTGNLPVDLYFFIRAAYGRRNATAHYGRFIVDDERQRARPWYKWAIMTTDNGHEKSSWLDFLQFLVHDVVRTQISDQAHESSANEVDG